MVMTEGSAGVPPMDRMRKQGIIILFFAVILALLGSTIYFYTQYRSISTSVPSKKDEISDLTAKVGRHILLPEETPKIVTVSDTSMLSGQPFFRNAKNGDKVLIYERAKKAFLYDPVADRVVEVGPVTFTSPSPGATTSAVIRANAVVVTPTPTEAARDVRFVLYNGTEVTGLTTSFEQQALLPNVPGASVVGRDSAARSDYPSSVLVDISGARAREAAEIAGVLGVSVGTLPAGEAMPALGDFLVIVGADRK